MRKITLMIAACFMVIMAHAAGGNITYELNGGVTNDYGWTNKADMLVGLNQDYNTHYNVTSGTWLTWETLNVILAASDPVTRIPTFATSMWGVITTPKWQWLHDYIKATDAAQSMPVIAETENANWRYEVSAFFISGKRVGWPASADYSVAGQPAQFFSAWGHVFGGPASYDGTTEVVLPDPYKEEATFGGWYDNAAFTGAKITSIPIGAEGDKTLYAKWVVYIPTCAEVVALGTGKTSRAGGIVTFIDGTTAYIQDATGGLKVDFTAAPSIVVGDKITLTGTTATLGSYISVTGATFLTKEAATVPTAQTITLPILNATPADYIFESVSLEGLTIVSYGSGSVNLKDASANTITLLATLNPVEFPVNAMVNLEAVVSYTSLIVLVGDPSKVAKVLAPPMTGIYQVGSAPGSDYALLSDAVTALNAATITGYVVLEINSDITEPANIGLAVDTKGFGITIRPDADVDRTITFTKTTDNTSPSGHLVIGYTELTKAWSDVNTIATNNVTIDGYAVGGTTRRLKLTTASGSLAGSKITVIVGACQNTTIKNCIYESKSTGGSAQCIGMIARKGTAIDVAPNGVIIDNNIITSVASGTGQGINTTSSGATAPTTKTTGLVVRNNTVKAQGRVAWFYYINGADFYNNEFHVTVLGSSGTVNYGIWTGTAAIGTFNIYNNKFVETSTKEAGTTGSLGIRTLSLGSGATYNIYNNMFSGMDRLGAATVAVNQAYIFYGGTGHISHNTFYMPALTKPTTAGYYNAIQLSSANPSINNNIFISDEDAAVNAFYSAVSTGAMDNNIYYNRVGTTKSLIVAGTTNSTLALHQAANPTKDINSKSVDVNFADAAAGDLSIAGTSIQDKDLEVPRLGSVLLDIFGTTRAALTYAGAHEALLPFLTVAVPNIESAARIMRTSNGVQVELDGEATIELYNINGVLLDKTRMNGSYSRDLDNGIYIIRINGKATKFIK